MAVKYFIIVAIVISACHGGKTVIKLQPTPPPSPTAPHSVGTRSLPPTTTAPTPRVCTEATNSMSPLVRLRRAMKDNSYTQMTSGGIFDAFLVFYSDEHLSEEPSAEERRLEYISGWDGAGTAVVMADAAAIWVPSSDVHRASAAVAACAWMVFDADDPNKQNIAEWIAARLGRSGRVGGDARLCSFTEWQLLNTELQRFGLQLISSLQLVDQLWIEEPVQYRQRPEFSRIVANLHHMEYTGMNWREKVELVRAGMKEIGAEAMVVTALDEVAWLLNIRGRDLPTAPLLKAFVVVGMSDIRVYAPPGKLSMPVREALAVYFCQSNTNCTRVSDHPAIYSDLRRISESKVLIPTAGTFQRGASAAIALSVPQPKRMFHPSPIIYLKAQKNEAEIRGMRRAHLRDAVAMCTLLSYLEGMVKKSLSELSIALKVDITRATQAGYVGISMPTRVAFERSGAEPEYRATNVTNRGVYQNSTLIIQSGGQYDEGTTVVTRTLHYGIPTRDMRVAYTTVLRSMAALATLQIPAVLPAAHTDPVARAPLWATKQDYAHPTGYGVGAALNRHEDPVVIDYRQDTNLHYLKEGYFITSEPAWYERYKYGVRLGNVLEVVTHNNGYLGFREATLIPFEPKLIDKGLLTEYEITWLNTYNDRIRKIVGPELKSQGLTDVYYWMTNVTKPLPLPSKVQMSKPNSAAEPGLRAATIVLALSNLFLVYL